MGNPGGLGTAGGFGIAGGPGGSGNVIPDGSAPIANGKPGGLGTDGGTGIFGGLGGSGIGRSIAGKARRLHTSILRRVALGGHDSGLAHRADQDVVDAQFPGARLVTVEPERHEAERV